MTRTYSESERKRRSELAKELHRKGVFGGAQSGSGRKKKRKHGLDFPSLLMVLKAREGIRIPDFELYWGFVIHSSLDEFWRKTVPGLFGTALTVPREKVISLVPQLLRFQLPIFAYLGDDGSVREFSERQLRRGNLSPAPNFWLTEFPSKDLAQLSDRELYDLLVLGTLLSTESALRSQAGRILLQLVRPLEEAVSEVLATRHAEPASGFHSDNRASH